MGYYDDHIKSSKQKQGRPWFAAIIGAIIGSAIMFFALSAITGTDVLSNNTNEEAGTSNQDQELNEEGVAEQRNVEVNIQSQITDIVDEVSDAVVGVVNIQNQNIFGQQMEQDPDDAPTGSGVVYKQTDGEAYVVTNYHVIEGADSVEVVFSEEEQVEAEVIGGDMYSDLAVLRVEETFVDQVIELGQSETINVGEPVLAIGNPLGLQFAGSVTQGIISGKDRLIPIDYTQNGVIDWQMEVIQTDAAINPGNSGGALVNLEGELIGINSMKIASPQLEGLGFAIPIDMARPIMEELEQQGAVTRSYLGISPYSLQDVAQHHLRNTLNLPEDVDRGVLVASVETISPADQAGLEQYDVIIDMNGEEIGNVYELRQYLYNETNPGDEIDITFYRNGELYETSLTLTSQEF
ncbi:S1C family serine protease [Alkalibacillus haloalkaliphilus]|uniref:S1C family serine protease n=1 Tax=Alkalibacillus haloalkaliphilus TaxID=94136 RepID=UPI0029362987|nr:trypsin-like peptidase domain-containing protein [Alkalibacillus haloalkaliphilus]MDV2581561.1 trypsin-like peptidase domain-containing protein [Alkalibacillus haloalkaliphilus]